MNEAQKSVFKKAIAWLDACGVEYVVRDAEGNSWHKGDIKLVDLTTEKRCDGRPRRAWNFKQYGYGPKIIAMQPGDSITLPFEGPVKDDKAMQAGYAAVITTHLRNTFGSGNWVTARSRDKSGVEIVRVA